MIYNKEDYTRDSCLTCLTRSTDTLLMLPFCNESFSVKVVRGAGVGTTECGVFPELSAQLSLCLSESSEHSVEYDVLTFRVNHNIIICYRCFVLTTNTFPC